MISATWATVLHCNVRDNNSTIPHLSFLKMYYGLWQKCLTAWKRRPPRDWWSTLPEDSKISYAHSPSGLHTMHCAVSSSTPERPPRAISPASGSPTTLRATLSCAVPPRRTSPTVDERQLDTWAWQAAVECRWWSHDTWKETAQWDMTLAAVDRQASGQQPCAPAATDWTILLAPQLLQMQQSNIQSGCQTSIAVITSNAQTSE